MDSLPIPELDVDLSESDSIDVTDVQVYYPAPPDLPRRKLLRAVPDEPDCYTMEIDNSSMELFNVCGAAAEMYLVKSREAARPADALSQGTAIHKAMDLRLVYGVSEIVQQKQFEIIVKHFHEHPPSPDDYRTADRAIQEIKKYNKFYPSDQFEVLLDSSGEPLVEISFNHHIITVDLNKEVPYSPKMIVFGATEDRPTTFIRYIYVIWTGRIDAIIRMDKRLWIMDHKTTSRGGDSFYDDFILAQQMMGYVWSGEKLIGEEISGLYLNAFEIRRPTKTGTPSTLKQRQYPYRRDQIDEWLDNMKILISDFVHHLHTGKFAMETKWCFGKYGKCQYHDVCTVPKKQRPLVLSSDQYRDVTWNPLLQRA